jgi:hypothetical protein
MQRMRNVPAVLVILVGILAAPAFAQAPPSFAPGQLDQLVARIALYPDPLLAQVLAAPSARTNCLGIPACKRCSHSRPCWT